MSKAKSSKTRFRLFISLGFCVIFLLTSLPAFAQEDLKPQILVDQALVKLNSAHP